MILRALETENITKVPSNLLICAILFLRGGESMPDKVKISDLTVEELKSIIQEIVRETLLEILDPDQGLEVREDLLEELRESMERVKKGEEPLIPAEEVARRLGLE